jgi:hypothetical protein
MLFAYAIELIAPADFNKKLIMIPVQEDSMAHHFVDVYLDPWAHAKSGSNRSALTSTSWCFSLR